jgi:hypothetical protein
MPSSPYADGQLADERRPVAREVQCARCAAVVLAAKFSPQQTSLQWTADAVRACTEFAAQVAAGQPTALIDSCASLRASIEAAVRDGRLPVVSPVPEIAAPEIAAPEIAGPETTGPETTAPEIAAPEAVSR